LRHSAIERTNDASHFSIINQRGNVLRADSGVSVPTDICIILKIEDERLSRKQLAGICLVNSHPSAILNRLTAATVSAIHGQIRRNLNECGATGTIMSSFARRRARATGCKQPH
jgi:hypothetical protein